MSRVDAAGRACSITLAEGRCPAPVEPGAPLDLCTRHLLEAYDWVARGVGETDLMPGPCPVCGSWVGVAYPSGRICANCEWRVGDVPDLEVADPRVDVVYYLRYRDQIKIGTSGNPRLRVASLPHDEVLAFELGDRLVEQRRHAQFAARRFAGTEWFAVHDELLAHIAELRLGVADPWQQYDRWVSRRLAAQN
ncbi:ATPase [Agromyces badenianii]|uniref:ATPase n=1 Tax=Agromyces badenianii TaxID=2080742 RepID=A0A2S0WSQ4_9MICO|nr:GIY-YIG nuclease family protein [Agromyces badenianii]AWB94318.1 ATPase [Agromyces badenianii]PWC05679.1 ATPase [Agromyces badenianii]